MIGYLLGMNVLILILAPLVNWVNGGGMGWMVDNPPGALLTLLLVQPLLVLFWAFESTRDDGPGEAT